MTNIERRKLMRNPYSTISNDNFDSYVDQPGEWKMQYKIPGFYESKLHPSLLNAVKKNAAIYIRPVIEAHLKQGIPYLTLTEDYAQVREYVAYRLFSSHKNISYDTFMEKCYVPTCKMCKIPYDELPMDVSSMTYALKKNVRKTKIKRYND